MGWLLIDKDTVVEREYITIYSPPPYQYYYIKKDPTYPFYGQEPSITTEDPLYRKDKLVYMLNTITYEVGTYQWYDHKTNSFIENKTKKRIIKGSGKVTKRALSEDEVTIEKTKV